MYRNDGRDQDLAVDSQDLIRAQKASAKKRLIVLGVVAVVLVAGGVGTAFFLGNKAKKEIQVASDRFTTCLVGDVGNDKPSVRFRGAQLVSMSTPRDKRIDDAWPQRCAPRAHAFNEALKSNSGSTPLAEEVEKLAKILVTSDATTADLTAPIEKIFELQKNEKIAGKIAADVAVPPAFASPTTLDTLPPEALMFGGPLTLASMHLAPFGESTFRFVVDDKDFTKGPAVCAIAPGGKEIACTKVGAPAAELSPGLRLWGTTDDGAKPYLFVGDRGRAGIFKADGARVVDKLPNGAYGASARADGSLSYLSWNEKPPSTHLFVNRADGSTKETLLVDRKESGNPYYSTNEFWDFVAYKQSKKGTDGIRLIVRDLAPNGDLGAPIDIGRIDETGLIEGGGTEEAHLSACRSADTTVLRAKGWQNTYLSFHSRQGWSPPVEANGLKGKMQCRSGEASIVQPDGYRRDSHFHGGVRATHCSVSGCVTENLDLSKAIGDLDDVLPREGKDVKAAFIENKLLVVWMAGDRGGLRMRLSPIDRFASAPETIVYDDHFRKGAFQPDSTLVGYEVLPLSKGALLLLATVEGVSAFLVDETGKLTPLPTKL